MSHSSASISLIIAVYKRPDLLERIFTSLLNQTFHDFEVLFGVEWCWEFFVAVV